MRWRTVRRVAATVFVGLAVPGAVAAAGIAGARGEVSTAREPGTPSAPDDDGAAPTHDPGRPTAVILLGSEGANAADVLAPQRQPVPLTGNLDLVPDLSLGQLDQRLPTGPEVIVVPQLSEVASGLPPSVAPVIAWLQRQRAQGDPLLVGVCVGAEVPAEAGLLDGRPATSHWRGLIGLRPNYPQVGWQDGVTFVPRADLASAAPGLDRLVVPGADAARRAAADGLSLPGRLTPRYLHDQPGFAFDIVRRRRSAPGGDHATTH